MAATMVNGTSATTEANTTNNMSNPGTKNKSTSGAPSNNKNIDTGRKPAGAAVPGDGPQNRNPIPKAWTSGRNPITQRSNTPGQSNGAGPQPQSTGKPSAAQEINPASKLVNHDRLLWLMTTSMGQNATIVTTNQDAFSGLFWGATIDNGESAYLLKMVRQVKTGEKGQSNGIHEDTAAYVGVGEDHNMTFNIKDVEELALDGAQSTSQDKYQNGSAAGFRTDTDISGNLAFRERQLQPWTSTTDTNVDLSLEGSASGGGETWDQFAANSQLFGLKTDYNEDYYTTTINRSSPAYREIEAKAQRIAREIEHSASRDAHDREERGFVDEGGDLDEESKYSGVRRNGADYPPLQSNQPNRYMPPARRPVSGKSSATGAPVDPAIISSQIARPDASYQMTSKTLSKPTEDGAPPEDNLELAKDTPNPSANVTSDSRQAESSKVPALNAVANVETDDALKAFKNFASTEKNRVAEDRKRRAVHDKAIKLNDLKKFSSNFKLHTPVPKDLVPILAKDTIKQQEIVEKAQREADRKIPNPTKTLSSSGDQSSSKGPDEIKADGTRAPPNTANVGRQEHTNFRQGFPPRGPQAGGSSRDKQQQFTNVFPPSGHGGQGMLSHRLADQHNRHKAGMTVSVPAPLPIHTGSKPPSHPSINAAPVPSSQTSSAVRTPTSAVSARLNVNAIEFRPNPNANVFRLPGAASPAASPRTTSNGRPTSRASSPSEFWGDRKPLTNGERPLIMDHFNPLKRLREKAQKENKDKDYAANGGIVYAHSTPVTWTQVKNEEDFKSYKDMYENLPAPARDGTPQQPATSPNQAFPNQLPPHLQHGPQGAPHVQVPQQLPYHGPPQPHHYPTGPHNFDERMQSSQPGLSAFSTPRGQNAYLAYPAGMGQPAPFPHAQPMPPYGMMPSGPQAQNFGRMPNGPPFAPSPGQHYAMPMMVHNPSQGGYMGPQAMHGPQMQMYQHGQAPPYGGQSQPNSGYPSPGRGAGTPMMHQGSFQGPNAPMYMSTSQYNGPIYGPQHPPNGTPMRGYVSPQPHFNQSPQQQPHFPHQLSRAPSNNYNHFPQVQYPHTQGQHPPPSGPMEGGEAMK